MRKSGAKSHPVGKNKLYPCVIVNKMQIQQFKANTLLISFVNEYVSQIKNKFITQSRSRKLNKPLIAFANEFTNQQMQHQTQRLKNIYKRAMNFTNKFTKCRICY